MRPWLFFLSLVIYAYAEDFPSLITANASIAIVLDRQFLGDQYQPILDELKNYIKELSRVELKHGGVIVHYYSWTAINVKKGFLAVFSVASCQDTWSLYERVEDEHILLFALTEVDCPRLPRTNAITVTFAETGEELAQLLLDLRGNRAFNWKSAIILHDNTLNRDAVSRVVQSLTLQIPSEKLPSISVTVFKMRYEPNDYLRRKEIYRVLSKLPVKYIGENFIVIVRSEVMSTMLETARQLRMSHTLAQWLYIITDTRHPQNSTNNDLFEGENVAYIYNRTENNMDCKNGILCYCKELMEAFISALDTAVQDEFDIAVQVSDEEWEAIRPTKIQRRDMLLKHMQQHISAFSGCGNCSKWQAMVADTWGQSYRPHDIVDVRDGENTTKKTEHVELLQVGFWRPVDGMKFQDVLFPHVEHGFRGRELPIVTYHNPPWTILHMNASGSVVSYGGLLFDIVSQLARTKNFTIRIILPGLLKPEDSSNGTSTDMMHSTSAKLTLAAVTKGKVALAVAAFTILSEIPPGINYTISVSIQPYSFMIARPRELSRALLFLLPFTTDTWLCLGLSVVLMGPTLYLVHRLSPYYDSMEITREGGLSTIHNCLWYVYGALLQQGGMYLPRADSGRLVVGTWWIVVLVVVTTYSGNLVAFLTFPKLELPVTTISELLQHSGTYTWSINKGSYLETQLKNSEEPKYSTLLKGAELLSSPKKLQTLDKAGRDLLNRVRNERHVVIDWKLRLYYLMRADTIATDACDFVISAEEFMEERIAMIVPADSPYLQIINQEINRMQKAGLITKWLSAYLPKRDRCWVTSTSAQEVNNHTVNLRDMQGSFFVLMLGIFSAATVLLGEWFYRRRKTFAERVVIKPFME